MIHVDRRCAGTVRISLFCVASALATTSRTSIARPDDRETEVTRQSLIESALRSHPAIRASKAKAAARRSEANANGSLPPPEVMTQIWQVPLSKPYAIGDAQMIMFGVGQTIPAIGARAARQRAGELDATADEITGTDRARLIRRELDHAFADYLEATARHRIHLVHQSLAKRTVEIARARHAGGGSLLDVAQAEVEHARVDADLITDSTRVEAARAKLNVLTGRDPSAALGPPAGLEHKDAETTEWDSRTALTKARESRPELRVANTLTEARRADAKAAGREALLPSVTVAALYFAPTTPMPQHGYGLNASLTLPWLWGEASARRDASEHAVVSAATDALASEIPINAEVIAQEANARAATLRFITLRDRALTASQRAFDVAWSGYESNRSTTVTSVLSARRAVVDVETEMIAARAVLDHALADLDAAVGIEVPRRKVSGTGGASEAGGPGHDR